MREPTPRAALRLPDTIDEVRAALHAAWVPYESQPGEPSRFEGHGEIRHVWSASWGTPPPPNIAPPPMEEKRPALKAHANETEKAPNYRVEHRPARKTQGEKVVTYRDYGCGVCPHCKEIFERRNAKHDICGSKECSKKRHAEWKREQRKNAAEKRDAATCTHDKGWWSNGGGSEVCKLCLKQRKKVAA